MPSKTDDPFCSFCPFNLDITRSALGFAPLDVRLTPLTLNRQHSQAVGPSYALRRRAVGRYQSPINPAVAVLMEINI